ncbi:MAG: hypothetical protein MJ162_08810 [Treponema sp.]|nr:hypothetical protein [Treponema sp.]
MTQVFDNWTDYDNWLVQNYENNSIYKIEEIEGGKLQITYCEKSQFPEIRDKDYKKPERRL